MVITPFIGLDRKNIDDRIQQRFYPFQDQISLRKIRERRPRVLLLNYLNYHFMLDFVPSIIGIGLQNKVVHYFNIRDIVYNLKMLRLFSIVRLVTQI